jgi:hypothetical protein
VPCACRLTWRATGWYTHLLYIYGDKTLLCRVLLSSYLKGHGVITGGSPLAHENTCACTCVCVCMHAFYAQNVFVCVFVCVYVHQKVDDRGIAFGPWEHLCVYMCVCVCMHAFYAQNARVYNLGFISMYIYIHTYLLILLGTQILREVPDHASLNQPFPHT